MWPGPRRRAGTSRDGGRRARDIRARRPAAHGVLVLDPRRAAAPAEIWSDETLEDDALEAMRPRHRGELGRLIDEVRRNEPAAPLEVELVQYRAAGAVWQAARRASVDMQDVEDHEPAASAGRVASLD